MVFYFSLTQSEHLIFSLEPDNPHLILTSTHLTCVIVDSSLQQEDVVSKVSRHNKSRDFTACDDSICTFFYSWMSSVVIYEYPTITIYFHGQVFCWIPFSTIIKHFTLKQCLNFFNGTVQSQDIASFLKRGQPNQGQGMGFGGSKTKTNSCVKRKEKTKMNFFHKKYWMGEGPPFPLVAYPCIQCIT